MNAHHEAQDSLAEWSIQQLRPAEACTEVGHPEDVDMSHVFPMEPYFRKHPTAPFWILAALCLLWAWLDSLA